MNHAIHTLSSAEISIFHHKSGSFDNIRNQIIKYKHR